jgi:hypothetical protein
MRNGAVPIPVSGYTDDPGPIPYNLALSERRARAVRDYLVAHGIAYGQIAVNAFGKQNPRAPTPDGVRGAQSRRVEISILPYANVAYGAAAPTCQTVQTTISVNGQQKPAYRQACRQPDGLERFCRDRIVMHGRTIHQGQSATWSADGRMASVDPSVAKLGFVQEHRANALYPQQ